MPYFHAALSRNDLSYVASEFRIFGAIFLEDGCSLFECYIGLFELGKVLYCEVLNFVRSRLRCRFLLNELGLAEVPEIVSARSFASRLPEQTLRNTDGKENSVGEDGPMVLTGDIES